MATKMFGDYDFELQSDELKRKQKLLDAITLKVMQPPAAPEAGRSGQFQVAAKINPLEGLTTALQGYLVGKQRDDLKKERGEFTEQSNQILREDMGNYQKLAATNPQEALLATLTSRHPMLRQFGMAQLEGKGKSGKTFEKVGQGELLIHPDTMEIMQIKSPTGDPASGVTMKNVGGDLYGESASGTGFKKLDNAPRVTTNVTVSPIMKGEGKFMEGIGEAEAKAVVAARDAKKVGQQTLATAARMEELVKNGTFSGPLANVAVTASSLVNAFNQPGVRETLANSEEFKGIVGKEAAAALSGPGGAKMTDKDMELFLSQYPQLTNSEQGQRALINSIKKAAARNIEYAAKVEERIRKLKPEASTLFDLDPSLEEFPTTDSQYPINSPAAPTARKYDPATGTFK